MGFLEIIRRLYPIESPKLKREIATVIGLNCPLDRLENALPSASWRRERNWDLTFSA